MQEVSNAVRAIQGKAPGKVAENAAVQAAKSNGKLDESHTSVWTFSRAEKLWKGLYGQQQKFVKFLVEKGGRATLAEAMKHLGLKKGVELAGVRSCLTRNARRETGYKQAIVMDWKMGEDGKWYYQLVPEVHELFKQIAENEQS
jgi:hypothetical protein